MADGKKQMLMSLNVVGPGGAFVTSHWAEAPGMRVKIGF
jgi:hypothetical protein